MADYAPPQSNTQQGRQPSFTESFNSYLRQGIPQQQRIPLQLAQEPYPFKIDPVLPTNPRSNVRNPWGEMKKAIRIEDQRIQDQVAQEAAKRSRFESLLRDTYGR